ncbi:unnamed protein product [Prorocentrum cordatum]|uniref:Uncharacterized protein n=1 Tax=Prorocentrum cordatum TaxID=2364126 RepID=A0ABN9XBE2_9DINO|nr:unnamed protein product [Polarella glacialis]
MAEACEPMAPSIADDVEEQFELCGVSTPHLQSRALVERRMAVPGKDAHPIAGTRRLALGRFLRHLLSAIAHGCGGTIRTDVLQQVWFDSMHMCDILAARGLNFAHHATSHATAVLRILWKMRDATLTLPSNHLSKLTEVLWKHGMAVQPVLPEDINSAESRILFCLGWQVWLPSLHWWLATFFSRLRVLTKQQPANREESEFEAVMTQMWQRSYTCSLAVVMHVASLGQSAPRLSATGLLGLCCVRAGLLQLHDVCPERLGAPEWEGVYARAMGTVPAFRAGSRVANAAQIVQAATGSSRDAIRGACWHVALALSDACPAGAQETV